MERVIQSFTTLFIYLIAIIPAVLLTNKAEKQINRGREKAFIVFSMLSLLLPCLLAAFRGENIGTDVTVYAEKVYDLSRRVSSFSDLLLLNTRFETGYLLIGYVSSRVFHSFHMMLFLTQLLINVPIYMCAFKQRMKIPMWSTMLCFYFLFYISTFNIMRESIGAAFILLAFVEILDNHKVQAGLLTFIAYLFHNTAIVGLLLMVFVVLFDRIKKNTFKILAIIGVVFTVLFAVNQAGFFLSLASEWGLIPQRYVSIYSVLVEGGNTYLSELFLTHYIELIMKWIGVIIPLLYYRKRYNIKNEQFKYTLFIGVLVAVLINTGVFVFMHSSYGYRVSLYLEYLFILWLPSVMNSKQKITINRMPQNVALLLFGTFSAFLILYIWRGSHGTFPFYFQIYK